MEEPGRPGSPACSGDEGSPAVTLYASDIGRRWEKIHADMRQLQISGVQGTSIESVYAGSGARRSIPHDAPLPVVGFASLTREPSDEEVRALVDESVAQVLGPRGLSALVRPGDRVVIKVNIVGPSQGLPGEKGRGIITDPRIVRHVAGRVREIIGFDGNADLKVIDATFTDNRDPSDRENPQSFYHARLERPGRETVWYDHDGDGILDGGSGAQLVNLDAVGRSERFLTVVDEPLRGPTDVWLPKFLRTREQAGGEGEFCDVYIGIPIFKSHGFCGMTGGLKLHWGSMLGLLEKQEHAGYGFGTGDVRLFLDYLCAMNRARGFDLVIMDALTANRSGPANKVDDPDAKTDFILTNAILCSRDPVAIDTVETLFAGYRLDSIPLLESAFRDGIGINRPAFIDLKGFDAFHRQKRWLQETCPGCGTGSYPLEDMWGNARTQDDRNVPADLSVSCHRAGSDPEYVFEYAASESGPSEHGLARIDLFVNGAVITRLFDDLSGGTVAVDLGKYAHQRVRYQIAAWDEALNCTLSEEREIEVA